MKLYIRLQFLSVESKQTGTGTVQLRARTYEAIHTCTRSQSHSYSQSHKHTPYIIVHTYIHPLPRVHRASSSTYPEWIHITYTQRKGLRLCVRCSLTSHRHSTRTPPVLWHLQPSTRYSSPPLAPSVCIPTGRPIGEWLRGDRKLVCPSSPPPPHLRLSRSYFACSCLSTPRSRPQH